ncbi:RHS repeat-associated core domain-containing protein [Curtobacterium sp. 1P10AnD]|uniref:RHS repeat-associated core domain-containing protein n=1 Tax=Curtobacterium sp. 1P10AnD TaxID=3132283 RepID=UPI0039A1819A
MHLRARMVTGFPIILITALTASLLTAVPSNATTFPVIADLGKPVPGHTAANTVTPTRGSSSTSTATDTSLPTAISPTAVTLPSAPGSTVHVHGSTGAAQALSLGRWAKVAKTDIAVAAASDSTRPSASTKAVVGVLGKKDLEKQRLSGLVVSVRRTDAGSAARTIAVRVPKQLLVRTWGADFASRAHFVAIPASGKKTATPVPMTTSTDTVVLAPKVSTRTMLLAATGTATSSSGTGSFAASPLKASSSWDVSAQTGDFSWQYPLAAPPAAAGPAPSLALNYDSQSIDGETGSTNNQPSAIGDGWELSGGGFIERQYVSCSQDDGASGAVSTSGDLCWKTDNATLSLGGHSAPLVRDKTTGDWKLLADDGSRVEHLTGTAQGCQSNGTYDTDCWRVTTTDGTQYYFGLNHLPGWASGNATTNSAWTVPVFGNDAGEPCHASTFAASSCVQAWRWNLDYVVDVHNNAEALYYNAETNSYGKNGSGATSYVRGGQLNHIDYGLTSSNIYTANAASDRVTFGYDAYGRCNDSSHANCTKETVSGAATKPATPAAYPDVPFDQLCASSCTANPVPTFWTDAMLDTVTTAARTASSTYTTVDTWTLSHSFPAPGDGTNAALWLTQVQHTGSAGQTAITEPATKFSGTTMQNRVWAVDGLAPLDKWRISSILDTTGSVTSVNYSAQDCQPSEASAIEAGAATNSRRCFPQWWTPQVTPAVAPKLDLFHKYVVTSVIADPKTGGGADRPQVTSYIYTGKPAWRYNTSPFTPEKNRTWSVYAGYNTVEVREGDTSSPSTEKTTDYVFYQGMDGDRAGTSGGTKSVTVTGDDGVTDSAWFAGTTRETKTLNGVGGAVIDDVINTPWASDVTASDGTNSARMLGDSSSVETQPTSSGGTRTKRITTTHDDDGNPATVSTVTSDAGSTCQSTTYAPDNTTAWIRGLPQEQRTVAVACGQAPSLPDDAISDVRTSYDGNAYGATPTKGDETTTQEVDKYDGSTPHFFTSASSTYDALGRVTANTDALGRTTTTAYTPATSGPLTKSVTTNPAPFKWTSTTTVDPTRGSVLSETATDGSVTTAIYDGLGRRVNVWLPQRPQASNTTSPSIAYAYSESQSAPLSVATTTVMAHTTATTYQLYDGLGRPVQTQSSSPSSGTIITDTQYDPAGNVSQTNNPYWTVSVSPSGKLFVPENEQQIGSSTQNIYDGAGRQTATVTKSFGSERFRTTIAYDGADETDVTPPSGGTPTSTWTNSLGQKTKLVQYLASTPSSTAKQQATTYGYDNRGNMTSTVDPAGNTWSWTYDLLGNKIKSVDPDTGTTTSTFDLAGRELTTTDARGQTIATVYDALDRKTAEYADAATTGPLLDSWTWDTVKKGQLSSSSSYTNSIAGTPGDAYTRTIAGYDAGNQPTGITTTFPASTPGFGAFSYNVSYTYNQDESLNNETYPAVGGLAAERIGYAYDGVGNMSSVTGNSAYASAIYTSIGQLAQINRGGNLTNSSAYGYDAATGAVTEIKDISGTGSATAVQADRTYTRNDAGTVTSAAVTGDAGTETQCYTYDQLQELTEAWTPSTNGCASPPSKTALGGPAAYWNSYTYDTLTGNRTSTTQHGVGDASDTTSTYSYPAAGAAEPHGVQTVSTGDTSSDDFYGYDQAGDTTAMPGQTLTYDADGRIATVTKDGKTQSDIYDADGTLLVQTDPDAGTTLFLGGTELHNHPDGTTTATRTYTLDGTAVDERTTDGGSNKVFSLDTDIDGTADLEIGASDQTITRRWVDPFGNERGATTNWSSTHGFLNKSESALTGLAQLGARAYDATLGRFLSVDPVFAPSNPQQDNGYSYSANSPITNADPSGACYLAYSDSLDFHTNCAGGIQKPVTHGSNAAVGAYGSKYTPPPGYRARPRPTPVHSGGGCSYDGGTLWCPTEAYTRMAAPQVDPAQARRQHLQALVDEVLWEHAMATSQAWPWIKAAAEWEHGHVGALEGVAGAYGGAYGDEGASSGAYGDGGTSSEAPDEADVVPGVDVPAAPTEGIYVIRTARGTYVGQSGNIDRRLAEHVVSGKFSLDEVSSAERFEVTGGKTAREVAEQRKIDELGGVGNLLNKVNPIGQRRIALMGPGYTR